MGGRLCGAKAAPDASGKAGAGKAKAYDRPLGYTVESFVQHYLVPVAGFCCVDPQKPTPKETEDRIKALRIEISKLHEQMNAAPIRAFDDAQGALHGVMASARSARPGGGIGKIPLEAVCRVWLDEAEVLGDVEQSFDFNQEAGLEVKVKGLLLFPPDGYPLVFSVKELKMLKAPRKELNMLKAPRKANENGNDKLDGKDEPEDILEDGQSRWKIKVEVWAMLERDDDGTRRAQSQGGGGCESGSVSQIVNQMDTLSGQPSVRAFKSTYTPVEVSHAHTRLKVKCLHMLVDSRQDQSGDAMTDSWLPKDNILRDIEGLLTTKLQQSTSEKS